MTKGFALISVLILSGFLSLLAIGFAFIMVSESKIGQAQELATQTHYLAEAGVQYALWQLNNDWKYDFENATFPEDGETIRLTDRFYSGDEIKIIATSIGPGNAQVESKAVYNSAERKVIVGVFKPLGGITEPLKIKAVLSGNRDENKNILFIMSSFDIKTGSIHSNNDLELNASDVWVEDTASSVYQIKEKNNSHLYVNPEKRIENAPEVTMPALDFDDYKQKANIISVEEITTCLAGPECILNGINYVVGSELCAINIVSWQKLTLNGFLLTDCSFDIVGFADLNINNTPNQPSGLASKKSINIGSLSSINIAGLLYSLGDIIITAANNFSLSGGIINYGDLLVLNQILVNKITINYDEDIIKTALGQPEDAPLIIINHWEEKY